MWCLVWRVTDEVIRQDVQKELPIFGLKRLPKVLLSLHYGLRGDIGLFGWHNQGLVREFKVAIRECSAKSRAEIRAPGMPDVNGAKWQKSDGFVAFARGKWPIPNYVTTRFSI